MSNKKKYTRLDYCNGVAVNAKEALSVPFFWYDWTTETFWSVQSSHSESDCRTKVIPSSSRQVRLKYFSALFFHTIMKTRLSTASLLLLLLLVVHQ